MFEGAKEFQNGVLIGLARNAHGDVAGAERIAERAMDLLEQAQARIKQLELELAVKKADSAAIRAQLSAYRDLHTNSPLLTETGQRFKESGNPKTKGRLIYEAQFDRVARENGIKDPVKHRAD